MHLLSDKGSEFTVVDGLGLIPGEVIPLPKVDGCNEDIPHVGWSALNFPDTGYIHHESQGFGALGAAYFCHSFYFSTEDPSTVTSTFDFCGLELPAAVFEGNVMGVQFHPEKSGPNGLAFLDRWVLNH